MLFCTHVTAFAIVFSEFA